MSLYDKRKSSLLDKHQKQAEEAEQAEAAPKKKAPKVELKVKSKKR